MVTTSDQMVPPAKQRRLASAIGADVFEFEGDHDSVAVHGEAFAEVTRQAIAALAVRTAPGG